MQTLARSPGAKNFQRAFDHLALPITTANEHLAKGWQPEQVWQPFWATVQDFHRASPHFRELISLIFDFNPQESTEDHRARFQEFISKNMPGYKILFEADILDAINLCLSHENSHERILGFKYGKDGRGAMPDRYYQLLFKHKYLVVGNHHDILGHFILLCDPEIRGLTERLAIGFSATLELQHHLRRPEQMEAREFERRTLPLRRVLRLYTLAWNLAQEKLYVQCRGDQGEPVLNLIGAFNSVYNTIFSSSLDVSHVKQVSGALGFFNRDAMDSILMTPSALREYCEVYQNRNESAVLMALDHYERLWSDLGLSEDSRALTEAMERAVEVTLFKRGWFKRSVRERWLAFSGALLQDPLLHRVFVRENLIVFSNALIDLAYALSCHPGDLSPR